MTEQEKILEGQLRECYGRVVYTHKTQEKMADILQDNQKCLKKIQFWLSAILTAGILSTLFELPAFQNYKIWYGIILAIISTVQLVLNSYLKEYDLGTIAQKHRQAAAEVWLIREKYLSLLTDLHMGKKSIDNIVLARDNLLEQLYSVYQGAPSTNFEAYQKASNALKNLDDMTFSDDEIDKFLPKELRRNNK